MRVQYIKLAVLFLVPLVGQQTIWASSENTNNAQVIRFRNQPSEGMNVVFEDTSLTQSEKDSILQDYQLLIGHLVPGGSRQIEKGRKTTLKQKTGDMSLSRALVFKRGRKKLPDGYESEFGLLAVGEDGAEHLVIPRRLSTAYRQALRLKDENKDAFSRLPKFIQFMNRLESENIPAIGDLFYLYGEARLYCERLNETTVADFVHEFGEQAYARPSILTIANGTGELQNMLTTEMTVIDKKSGARIAEQPLVYHDDRWKILIIIPGT